MTQSSSKAVLQCVGPGQGCRPDASFPFFGHTSNRTAIRLQSRELCVVPPPVSLWEGRRRRPAPCIPEASTSVIYQLRQRISFGNTPISVTFEGPHTRRHRHRAAAAARRRAGGAGRSARRTARQSVRTRIWRLTPLHATLRHTTLYYTAPHATAPQYPTVRHITPQHVAFQYGPLHCACTALRCATLHYIAPYR